MTFNQIAEIFAARWSKEVNRTHIASIMRLREKSLIDSANTKKAKLFSSLAAGGVGGVGGDEAMLQQLMSDASSMLAQQAAAQSHPPTTSAHASVANSMPMSGLDLLRLVDNDDKTKNFKPVTSISSMLQNAGQSQPSCIVANEFAARGSQKINCEKCPSAFDTQSQLITHILTTPDHLGGDGGLGAMQNNSFANAAGVYNVKPEFNS